MNWYYKIGDAKIGPVNDKQILELAELGKITSETIVWNEHFIKWQTYGEALDKARETELNSHSPEEDTPEAAWDSYFLLVPADTENHDDPSRNRLSDLSLTAPDASGNLPRKSWSGTAPRKSVRLAKRFFLTS